MAPQFIQAHTNGCAMKPSCRGWAMGLRSPPEFPEDLDGYFFGASGIPNHPHDYPDDAIVMSVEERFETLDAYVGRRGVEDFASSNHNG